jgi:hypothetical protein
MADFKVKYPASNADTTAITISLASLASSSSLLAGQEATAVVNTTNLDEDHLVGGVITVGTTPTTNTRIEIWAVMPRKIASGTATWPDVFDGTDSAETITAAGIKAAICRLLGTILVDSTTSNRAYDFAPASIRDAFGEMPPTYTIFVTHNTGVNLNSTAGNHEIHYHRVQSQSV